MKKRLLCLIFLGLLCFNLHAETPALVFHDMGRNLLGALGYNYGIAYMAAGLGTWAFIGAGIDWQWRNLAYNNRWLPYCGLPGLYLGYVVPALTPVALYATGRVKGNEKLLIAGLALAQSALLTLAVQTPLKMITGRASPGIVSSFDHSRKQSPGDFSGKFNWFNGNFIAGWPSGHTANAFAAAATITELYQNNLWLTIGAYSYAALIGVGVTLNVHWASEALAGALIGYAVGKTVGKSFNKLLKKENPNNRLPCNRLSFYAAPTALGVIIRF
jgi:membrane-associated phospholipid phosphatase